MARLVKVTDTRNLPPGSAAAFDVEGNRIALFNVGGTIYAIEDTCTHAGASLAEGTVEGTKVTCPWHGAEFDLTNGSALTPPAFEGVRTFRVVVEGDAIHVEI
jgi:3-phenylpropionate/trans-cinnamate dioxygenase ferredoxin subunit